MRRAGGDQRAMTISQKLLCCSLLLLLTNGQPSAQTPNATETSCRKFVQQFYDWYLPKARTAKVRAADIVLRYKSDAFSPELRRQLKADSTAQAKARGELVGLDFDPFLNTQDPSFERCTVGKIASKGGSYWAEVTCKFPGANGEQAHVTPELIFQQGRWVFVNFHYQEGSKEYDLLGMLKALSEERKPHSK